MSNSVILSWRRRRLADGGASNSVILSWRRWRLAGSRALQVDLNVHCDRVRATKHASRSPFRLLEDIHGLAKIVERGASVEATDAVLLVGALRALTNARRGVLVYISLALYAIDDTSRLLDGVPRAAKARAAVAAPRAEQIRRDRGRVARGRARRSDARAGQAARLFGRVDDRVPPGTPGSAPVDGAGRPEAPQLAAAEASGIASEGEPTPQVTT